MNQANSLPLFPADVLFDSVIFCGILYSKRSRNMRLGQESLVELRTEIPRIGQDLLLGQGFGIKTRRFWRNRLKKANVFENTCSVLQAS